MKTSVVVAAALAATVSAHGNITSPPARLTGPNMVKACGQTAVSNVLADGTIPLEDVFDTTASCQLDLCRGAVFADNKARVQMYSPGQVVEFKAEIPIPHEGPANVSVVKTSTNKILGNMLIVFDSYADEKLVSLPPNNTDFSVTIPTDLAATDCRAAGDCVLQWFWFGTAAKQTYESCVDFILVGSGSNSTGSSGSSGSSGSNLPVSAPVDPNAGLGNFGGVEGAIPINRAAKVNSVSGSFGGVEGSASARRSKRFSY